MDTIYIGNIPLDYKYATFSDYYITLYNQPSARDETLTYYRIYKDSDYFYFSTGTQYFGNYTSSFTEVPVSNEIVYRRDFDIIVIITFIFIISGIWFFNLISSLIRKGGCFGGLL